MNKWQWISAGVVLQFCAIILFGMGFLPQKPSKTTVEPKNQDNFSKLFDGCHAKNKSPLKNLVIMVIDAFRDEFLLNSQTMNETRALIERGEAKVFRAHVQQPTVTTPRIKALLSGTVPLFSELLLNFASTVYVEDNWLRRAKDDEKRILFFGDEVWLELLPSGIFENRSEGIDSFFVKDYTQVDSNVTRHLDRELSSDALETWDVLVLHFLGLDHIGHSLGGDHPQIDVKLKEMDEIILKIYEKLLRSRPTPGEFALFVLGDHGMSLEGNHGGNSDLETHVPVVVVKKGMKKYNYSTYPYNTLIPEFSIEQIDLNPVWCALLNLNYIPLENLGVSFLPLIEPNWRIAMAGLRQNVVQFIHFLETYYDGRNERLLASLTKCIGEMDKLCVPENSEILEKKVSNVFEQCRNVMMKTQDEIMGPLSSYNHNFLLIGICISFVGVFCLLLATLWGKYPTLRVSLLAFLHPLLMFSSSFVEEEHDIWYFLLPLISTTLLCEHLCYTWSNREDLRKLLNQKYYSTSRQILHGNGKWLISILGLHRLASTTFVMQRRRWVLFAEQKTFDCGLDTFFPAKSGAQLHFEDFVSLLSMLSITLFYVQQTLNMMFHRCKYSCLPSIVGFSSVLCIKLSIFELSSNTAIWRMVHFSIMWLMLSRNFSMAFSLWLFFVLKPTISHIFVLSWLIGYAIGSLKSLQTNEIILFLHCSMSAAFFYTGNTNSVSSLDISVGYAGLSSYQPVLVGAQILLNAYLGPICVFSGWYFAVNRSTSKFTDLSCFISGEKSFLSVLDLISHMMPTLLLLRSNVLLCSLISLFMFRHHLFVWSVFAPKLIYEIVHLLTATIFAIVSLLFHISVR